MDRGRGRVEGSSHGIVARVLFKFVVRFLFELNVILMRHYCRGVSFYVLLFRRSSDGHRGPRSIGDELSPILRSFQIQLHISEDPIRRSVFGER